MPSTPSRRLVDRLFHPLVRRIALAGNELDDKAAFKREEQSFLVADLLIAQKRVTPGLSMRDWEFRVCSQWGQDGIIQYLIDRVPIASRTFVEFGVQNYRESSTRFLLMHDNWSGMVIDGSNDAVHEIQHQSYYWQHDLFAHGAFITRDNINDLIGRRFTGDLGLLVIDIDGNDYWIWEAVTVVKPCIVVCEYNSVFGSDRAISVPYRADFARTAAHYSNLYFGASLPALCQLARLQGYVFAGCNSHGNDAFFVRTDLAHNITAVTPAQGFVESKFRESRDPAGGLTHLAGHARLAAIEHLPVHDFTDGVVRPIKDVNKIV